MRTFKKIVRALVGNLDQHGAMTFAVNNESDELNFEKMHFAVILIVKIFRDRIFVTL